MIIKISNMYLSFKTKYLFSLYTINNMYYTATDKKVEYFKILMNKTIYLNLYLNILLLCLAS